MSKPECTCPPMYCTDDDEACPCPACIPKKRGRPKGSKNKVKVILDTDADGVPVVLEPETPETVETVPLVPTIPNADGTTCEDCKEYLTCDKITNLDSLPPTCKKFFNNFIVENDTETEEALKEVESIKEEESLLLGWRGETTIE